MQYVLAKVHQIRLRLDPPQPDPAVTANNKLL